MAKRSPWKIVLVVLGVVFLLGMLAVGVCVFSGVFWFKENVPAMREAGERAQGEATQFAVGHTQSECVDEGLRRHDNCGAGMALVCRTEVRLFLDGCLRQATPSPGLCEGVPAATEVMRSANWGAQYCRDHGRPNDQQCPNVVRAIVDYCQRP
jgi:hypothetical protein